MKNISVKISITLWLTLLMALLAILFLSFMLSISNTVAMKASMSQLSYSVKNNLQEVDFQQGRLNLKEGFQFYQNGISTLVYSQSKALLAGQLPVSFTVEEHFQNGITRIVDIEETHYLILDIFLPIGWENGVWLRGLMEAPRNEQTAQILIRIALIALPLFLALAALGSYWIANRAFQPLHSITSTAKAINEASDLSRRIGLPIGKNEFSRLAETFDQLFERLERSFEAEKQFTADASHELRTPVSIIKGACEYAQKYDETLQERQETIDMIYRQALKMSHMISELLNMTRLEQGMEYNHLEYVNLAALLDNVCKEHYYNSQHYNPQKLYLNLKEEIVLANSKLLSRLIHNLIENGFKYGKPEGHIWISIYHNENEVLLEIKDDGIGIASDQKEKIWQRFYQVDPSRSEEMGAGLGLSMVWQIAKLHNGYMTLDSVLGEGSTFTLHLPAPSITLSDVDIILPVKKKDDSI